MPAFDQISLLRTASGLGAGTVMRVKMRCAIRNRVSRPHTSFKALVQITGLGYVNRDPSPVFSLPGINIIAGNGPEISIERVDLVRVPTTGLPRPVIGCGRQCAFRLRVTTKHSLNEVHQMKAGHRLESLSIHGSCAVAANESLIEPSVTKSKVTVNN